MKYKPLHSNFEELQDEIVEEVLSVGNKIEDIKDAIAKQIDDYVEAILKEHVEEANVSANIGNADDCVISITFYAGQKTLPNGTGDSFRQEVPLTKLLDEFFWWDELSDYEPELIRKTATKIADFAQRLQQRADEIQKENEEFERDWEERRRNELLTDKGEQS